MEFYAKGRLFGVDRLACFQRFGDDDSEIWGDELTRERFEATGVEGGGEENDKEWAHLFRYEEWDGEGDVFVSGREGNLFGDLKFRIVGPRAEPEGEWLGGIDHGGDGVIGLGPLLLIELALAQSNPGREPKGVGRLGNAEGKSAGAAGMGDGELEWDRVFPPGRR